MKRRAFIISLSVTALVYPIPALAQQKAMPAIGYLSPTSPDGDVRNREEFIHGLGETGFVDGHNVNVEYRWANAQYDRLAALAGEFVARKVDLIEAGPLNAALAAKQATSAIPIVFAVGVDPVEIGLVASLSHPGGNLTGVALVLAELMPKRLQLLHETLPDAATIGVLFNPRNANREVGFGNLNRAADALGVMLAPLPAVTEQDVETAFAAASQRHLGALLVGDDPFFEGLGLRLTELAAQHRIPTLYFDRRFPAVGGLMSYGGGILQMYLIGGQYAGRILHGEKPADLPVQQPTKFELVVNLKTAETLGLTVPPLILARADEVIE